jgi:hypothetical protein
MILSLIRICWLTWLVVRPGPAARFRQGFADAHACDHQR